VGAAKQAFAFYVPQPVTPASTGRSSVIILALARLSVSIILYSGEFRAAGPATPTHSIKRVARAKKRRKSRTSRAHGRLLVVEDESVTVLEIVAAVLLVTGGALQAVIARRCRSTDRPRCCSVGRPTR
jgi:hypothetical protein